MATNLLKAGKKVSGYDLNTEFVENFKKEGGHSDNLNQSIKESDVIFAMLPNFKASDDVWKNAYKHMKKGAFIIDTSTFSPVDAKVIGEEAKGKGFIPAICPVSGGVQGAKNGTLSFMIGSDKDQFEMLKTILQPMGKNFYYCGDFAGGQTIKICNNLCLAIQMVGFSESMALGVKLGADPKVVTEVMSTSTGRCYSVDTYNPVPGVLPNTPASRNYDNGYNNELMKKDLVIANECAESVKLDAEIGRMVRDYYIKLVDLGKEKKDMGYVYQYILGNKKV
ncbi:MAG: NAD-binding protein [PVC group bacterium]|nr:NAD-binding protein [PVC group bacterium]